MFVISPATSIFFILDPQENRCMSREMPEKSIFSGVFYVSGEREEDNNKVKRTFEDILRRAKSDYQKYKGGGNEEDEEDDDALSKLGL
jgi:hypothetical protein